MLHEYYVCVLKSYVYGFACLQVKIIIAEKETTKRKKEKNNTFVILFHWVLFYENCRELHNNIKSQDGIRYPREWNENAMANMLATIDRTNLFWYLKLMRILFGKTVPLSLCYLCMFVLCVLHKKNNQRTRRFYLWWRLCFFF